MSEFGDSDIQDAVIPDDPAAHEIDWDQVIALQGAYDYVLSLQDEKERLEAAKALVAEMHGR